MQTRRRAGQRTARHRRAACVAVGAGQRHVARTVQSETAHTGHGAGIGAVGALIEHHRGIVQDVALQARRRARQRAGRHRRAAGVAVDARQGHVARAALGEAARARHRAGIGAVEALVEHDGGVVHDVALKARRRARQRTGRHRRAARVAVGPGQRHVARAALGEPARTGHDAGIGAVGALVEHDGSVVHDVALQARRRARERTGRHRRAARVAVGAGQRQVARAALGEPARTGHGAGIGAVEALIEHHRGIVHDVALQARRRALQDARRDRRAAAVGVGAAEDERPRAGLGQAARAADRARQGERIAVAVERAARRRQRDRPRAREARRRLHRAARQGERRARRAEGAVGTGLHDAAGDRRPTRVGAAARQGHRARPHVGHRAVAADAAGEHDVVGTVEGQEGAAGDHHIAGDHAGRAAVAELQDARRNGGHARIGVVAGEDQRAAALLDEPAGAADHAREDRRVRGAGRQAVGAQCHDAAGDTAEILDRLVAAAARDVERRPRRDEGDPARRCDAARPGQRQRAARDRGGAGVGVGAREGQLRAARLGQSARIAGRLDHAGEGRVERRDDGQRGGTQKDRRSRHAAQVLHRHRCKATAADVEDRAGAGEVEAARCGDAAVAFERQDGVALDGRGARVGVHAGQALLRAAGDAQAAAGPAAEAAVLDRPAEEGQAVRDREFLRAQGDDATVATLVDQTEDGRARCRLRDVEGPRSRAASEVHGGIDHRARALERQRGAAVDSRKGAEGRDARQSERAAPNPDAAERAVDRARELGRAGGDRQHLITKLDRAGPGQRADVVEDVVADVEGSAAGDRHDRRLGNPAAVRQRQRSAVDRRGPGIGVDPFEGQRAAAGLGQPARAADDAAEAARKRRADRQRPAAQRHEAVGNAPEVLDRLVAGAARDVERGPREGEIDAARRDDAACPGQRQRAGVDGRRAGVSIGAGQGQRAVALLDQPARAAVAVDDAGEGRRGGRSHRQVVVAEQDRRSSHALKGLDHLRAGATAGDIENRTIAGQIHDARTRDRGVAFERQHGIGADRRGAGIGVRSQEGQ